MVYTQRNSQELVQNETIVPIGNLLKFNYIIPNYQRNYVWSSEEGINEGPAKVFLNDLMEEYNRHKDPDNNSDYLFGTIIVHKESNNTPGYIVDGQQRLTTCTLFLLAAQEIANEIYSANKKSDELLEVRDEILEQTKPCLGSTKNIGDMHLQVAEFNRHTYFTHIVHNVKIPEEAEIKEYEAKIIEIDNEKNEYKAKIKENGENKKEYKAKIKDCDDKIKENKNKIKDCKYKLKEYKKQNLVINNVSIPQDATESQKTMFATKHFFKQKLQTYICENADSDVEKLQKLNAILNTLLTYFIVVYIEKVNKKEAHRIFETINTRGKNLTQADLLKNYAYLLCDNSSPSGFNVDNAWKTLSEDFKDSELTSYIRYYWITQVGSIGDAYVYRSISNTIDTAEKMEKLCNTLTKYKALYRFMTVEGSENYEIGTKTENILMDLRVLEFKIHSPLVFAMVENNFTDDEMSSILKLLEVYFIRNITICGGSTNDIWKVITRNAYGIINGASAADVQGDVNMALAQGSKTQLAEDKVVIESLKKKHFNKGNEAPKVLLKLLTPGFSQMKYSAIELEHILPQKPNKDQWLEFKDCHGEYCYKLGNMALLTCEQNEKVSNLPYDEKRAKYLTFKDNQKIVNLANSHEHWLPSTIDET